LAARLIPERALPGPAAADSHSGTATGRQLWRTGSFQPADVVAPSGVDINQALFLETRDSYFVWRAWNAARLSKEAPPAWVLDEFDKIGTRYQIAVELSGPVNPLAHARGRSADARWGAEFILGMFDTEGIAMKGTPGLRAARALSDWNLASRVRLRIDEGHNKTDAIYLVANDEQVSEPTVSRAWERFETIVRQREAWVETVLMRAEQREEQAFFQQLSKAKPERQWFLPRRCAPCRAERRRTRRPAVDTRSDQPQPCVLCGEAFKVGRHDREYFAKRGWAPPTRCRPCRQFRRVG